MYIILIVDIPYSSNITLKNVDSNVYLHSHSHRIPLKHKDGRISSNGQQVNAYEHSDENSIWQILPCELKKTGDPLHEDVKKFQKRKNITVEVKRDVRYLRVGDYVRLMHVATNSFLRTHDVASPMTQTHMEVTTVIQDVLDGKKCEYEAILWKVVSPDLSVGTIIKSKKQSFKLINVQHNVAVFSDVKSKLPAWGFGMQELNGNKEISAKYGNLWTVQEIKHDRFIDGIFLLIMQVLTKKNHM
jgi:dolichyl-phosphate-mannose-protein mannosyltransferase